MVFTTRGHQPIPLLPLRYDSHDPDSASRLIYALRPTWKSADSTVEFVRFTDGITNTLLKAVNRKTGLSDAEINQEAILLRAYGHGTDLIIDRQREARNHELLMQYGLAPELLARFENGMLYRFVRGTVTRPDDLRRPEISAAIARRLAQWHATVPCGPESRHGSGIIQKRGTKRAKGETMAGDRATIMHGDGEGDEPQDSVPVLAPGKPEPNVWSVMQGWINALPTNTDVQRQRQAVLQAELRQLIDDLSQRPGLGKNGLVFAHDDLLSGNIIVLPTEKGENRNMGNGVDEDGYDHRVEVTFIDYEYAVPSPAAFDIANHFAEWGGFDCDMSVMPTISQRRVFVHEYVQAYARLSPRIEPSECAFDTTNEEAKLLHEVDVFRGLPGFYWGIWALIQTTISEIDFDYASYAETRLSEYWAWKAEVSGERAASGAEMPLREKRWAQDAD